LTPQGRQMTLSRSRPISLIDPHNVMRYSGV
jgi:hypothetical protein